MLQNSNFFLLKLKHLNVENCIELVIKLDQNGFFNRKKLENKVLRFILDNMYYVEKSKDFHKLKSRPALLLKMLSATKRGVKRSVEEIDT